MNYQIGIATSQDTKLNIIWAFFPDKPVSWVSWRCAYFSTKLPPIMRLGIHSQYILIIYKID